MNQLKELTAMNFSRKQMKGMYAGDRRADRFCIGALLVILLTWCFCYPVHAEEKLEVTITKDTPQVGVADVDFMLAITPLVCYIK